MVARTQVSPYAGFRDERGMALVLSLVAIIVIGALVGGMMTVGRIESVSSRSTVAAMQAHEQAETGLTAALVSWDPAWNALSTGNSASVGPVTSGSNRYRYTMTRLGGGLFTATALGERLDIGGNPLAARSLTRLVRLNTPDVVVDAALEGLGNVRVGGTSSVSGADTPPDDWGAACTGPLNAVPGVRASGTVQTNGGGQILGGPPAYVQNDSTVQAQNFLDIYNQLLPAVNKTLAGGNYNGMAPDTTAVTPGSVCNRALANNWGEPGDTDYPPVITQCRSYMPVMRFTGNTTVNNGKGQGVMLVEGDLRIQGTFIFDGIILATGNIDFHGTGGASSRIYGALFAANSADVGDLISVTGAPVITYSSCAVAAVLTAAGRGIPLTHRSWAQAF